MASAKRGGLGKGLDSLIANKVGAIENVEATRKPEPDKEVTFVKITKVELVMSSQEKNLMRTHCWNYRNP